MASTPLNDRVENVYPLTPLQEGILFHWALAPASSAYFVQIRREIHGDVNVPAFQQAWQRIFDRHPILRTSFVWKKVAKAMQVVSRRMEFPFKVLDWTGTAKADLETRTAQYMKDDRAYGFDLGKTPLARVALIKSDEQVHMFVFSFHHILLDGWSVALLLNEVSTIYESLVTGTEPWLKQSRPYSDYLKWLHGQEEEGRNDAEAFWREYLAGVVAPPPLPWRRGGTVVDGSAGEQSEESLQLSEESTQKLQDLGRTLQVTLNTLIQGAWGLLLSRLSGEKDVVFGATVSGRPAAMEGVEEMVGLFINTLPVRVSIPASIRITAWLKHLQAEQVEMRQYEYCSLVDIQSWSEVSRGRPLFESLFVFENYPIKEGEFGSAEQLDVVDSGSFEQTNFPFNIIARISDKKLAFRIIYSEAAFENAAARRLLGYLHKVVEGITSSSDLRVEDLTLLSKAERHELLVEWNPTEVEYPAITSIQQLFEEQAAQHPDAVAVMCDGEKLSYGALNRRANQLAHCLRQSGVGAESKIGICVGRSLEMLVGILGILKAGGAYVPLDPNYPAERLSFMVQDSGMTLLLTQEAICDQFAGHGIQVVCIDKDWERIALHRQSDPEPVAGPGNLAYVIYTSGSTGRPKGVGIPHASCLALLHWAHRVFDRNALSGVLASTSMCFDLSIFEFFVPLSCGASVIVVDNALALPTLDVAAANQITLINTVPSVLSELLEAAGLPAGVRVVTLAGEPLRRTLVKKALALESVEQVWNLYGPTEGTTYSTYTCMGQDWKKEQEQEPTIGKPIANTRAYVLDERMEPVAVGIEGELYIGGAGLARGYLNRPQLTAEKFVPNPFGGKRGDRLYSTGDRARWRADKQLEFLGRRDEQVKVRGFRIELGEIETALLGIAEIAEAVVVVREEIPGDKRVVGYVVGRGDEVPNPAEVKKALKAKLPEYMVPDLLVVLEQMPLTPNGKVDRRALPAVEATPVAKYGVPRTPQQEVLASIWSKVLGMERVGIDENFFELGGHSLLMMRVMSRIREAFQLELPLRVLFEHPTVRELAEVLEATRNITQGLEITQIVPVDRAGGVPLSYAQQRLMFLDQLEPDSPLYNVYVGYRLKGKLDQEALAWSVNEIVRRHETLRTRFVSQDASAMQFASPNEPVTILIDDLSALETATREIEAKRLISEEVRQPFNLCAGPLFRVRVMRLHEEEHVLVLVMHHIITDEWSMGVLLEELSQLYKARKEGQKSPLKELQIQYGDYAVWQRGWLSGAVLEQQLEYWKKRLGGAPEVLELPVDHVRPAVMKHSGATCSFVLPDRLSRALRALSQRESATLFMTLMAGYAALLSRLTGQEDTSIGIPVANRSRVEVEELIGFFVNTLVIRTEISGEWSFRELVGRMREAALEAYAHQDVAFEMVVEALQPERSMNRTPLFQVMFTLQSEGAGEFELSGLQLEGIKIGSGTGKTKFDLTLSMGETATGLTGRWEYNTELFEAGTIGRMSKQFELLLEGAVGNPEQALSEVAMLTAEEREELVVEKNRTETDYPENGNLQELFEEQVKRRPEAVAVVCGKERLSYGELNSRANQLAHYLREQGVGEEVKVGICVERSVEMVVGILGIVKAGGAYVPIDPGYPAERVGYMVQDAGLKLMLTQEALRAGIEDYGIPVISLDKDRGKDWERMGQESKANPGAVAGAENLVYVIYTSGSTGQAKGVGVIQRAVVRLVCNTNYVELGPEEVVLQAASISFDASTFEIWGALLNGGRCVVLGQRNLMPEDLKQAIERDGVSTMWLTASLYNAVMDESPESLVGLRQLLIGGEALSRVHVERGLERLGEVAIINGYGPTEGTTFTCCEHIEREQIEDRFSIPIGVPVANTQVYVLDERMEPVAVGVVGELYIGGAGLARGYINRPGLTGEKFVPNPFSGKRGARLYRTGDRTRWLAEGKLEFLGRRDGQVKVRGYRIELGEIEAALLGMEEIAEAVVVVREDEPGDRRLVGYVVGREGEGKEADVNAMRRALKAKLPEHMVPAIVVLERMPLTVNGKIDRRALPAAEGTRGESYKAPRTAEEEVLAGIWAQVLEVERVGIDENFFELGGHSLLAMRVMSRIREAFQVEMPLRALFEAPTVRELAERIEAARRADQELEIPQMVRREKGRPVPLSYMQQRLWFLDQLEPDSALYNVYVGYRMKGELKREALQWSIGELVRRHETLRTRFVTDRGAARQVIEEYESFTVERVDLTGVEEGKRKTELERVLSQETKRPFDLAAGPVIRATLVKMEASEHILVLVMHHIVTDEWSMGVLVKELAQLYEARRLGQESPLKEFKIQYADYAVWQRGWLSGAVLERELEYWRGRLSGAPEVLELPVDHARPAVMKHSGAIHTFVLPERLSGCLRELSQREGATLFMTLLAGYAALLGRLGGQEDISIGIPISNRTRAEVEGLVGFFVNTAVIRTEMEGEPSFRELVGRVREAALGAYLHKDVPLEMVVEAVGPERSLSHTPLFQVMFTLQSAETTGSMALSGLEVEGMEMTAASGTTKFDLTLGMWETEIGLTGRFEYSTELFEAGTIERMTKQFELLLEGAVADPAQPLRAITILTAEERREMLVEWNRREVEYREQSSVQEMFEEQAARQPDAVAVSYKTERLNYGELNARANQLAHYLRERGVGAEVKVGICVERSLEMVVGILGIVKAGGAYVALDPGNPAERLNYMVKDAGLKMILTQEAMGEPLGESGAEQMWIGKDKKGEEGKEWERVCGYSRSNPGLVVEAGNLVNVMYTSGSRGEAVGVGATQQAVVRLVGNTDYVELGAEDVVLQVAALSMEASTFEVWGALLNGGRLVGVSQETGMTAEELLEVVQEEKVTTLFLPTAQFNEVTRREAGGLSSVKQVMFGGEEADAGRVRAVVGEGKPQRLLHVYGATENTTFTTWEEVEGVEEEATTVAVGVPVANTQVYVLDERMEPVAVGVVGELYIGGAGLARGYINRPGLTGEKFVPNPFSGKSGARLYRTGDWMRWTSKGKLEFVGRRDGQVKVRGYRIELGEIEAALLGMEEIAEAVVVVREDEPGDRQLVGYVVGKGSEAPNVIELRKALQVKLPEYMVPGLVVALNEMPLTANGKIDRRALPAAEGGRGGSYEAPRTAEEEVLAGIWAQVLEVERVGIDENFFELGGHSLVATLVMIRIREAFRLEMPLQVLFEAPTVRGLAERIEGARRAGQGLEVPGIERAERGERIPLSYAQQRLWFLDQLEPDSALYNVYVGYRMKGELKREALEWSIGEIVRRHETLRTRFVMNGEEPMQVIGPWKGFAIARVDLQGLGEAKRKKALSDFVAEESRRPFSLIEGPVFRATLVELEAGEHVLMLVMHHIVADERSLRVLLDELSQLYEAHKRGQKSPLKELQIQYADYAVWQRGWLSGAVLEQQLEYWRGRLSGAPEVLELPTDHVRPAVMKHSGATCSFVLPDRLSRALRALSQRESATLFMTLLAGYAGLLARLAGQEDISIGIPIANRTRAEVEELIGFFVNTLVIRTEISGEWSFRELVGRVREAALEAYAHQDVPFEMVVEALQPERNLSHAPLFQVMFTLQSDASASATLSGIHWESSGMTAGIGTSKFDLTLSVQDSSGDLMCGFEYNTELFEAGTIGRMSKQFELLLEGAVGNPEQALSEVAMLTAEEREELVVEKNRTETDYPENGNLQELFEEQVKRRPEAVAVVCGKERLSYGELNSRANQLAHYLREQGVGEEVKVGICVERSVEMVVGILGIVKAGGAYVPIDPGYPAERVSYMVRDSGLKLMLTQEALRAGIEDYGIPVISLDKDRGKDWERMGQESKANPGAVAGAENLVYVIYTSGSTGQAKGVGVIQRAVVRLVCNTNYVELGPEEVVLQAASISFDASTFEIWGALLNGGRCVVLGQRNLMPEDLKQAIERDGVSTMWLTASLYNAVMDEAPESLVGLRQLLIGGEALSRVHVERGLERLGEVAIINGYGPTEGTTFTCCEHIEREQIEDRFSIPIGVPVANTQVYVLDERMEPVAVGVVGELYIGGAGLARGYINRPGLTGEKFVPNPFSGKRGARLYRTGDRTRWLAEGKLEFLGRRDGQVKVRGYRIELGEIEAALLGMEEIAEAVVVVREDEPGDRRLVGYVVGREGEGKEADVNAMRRALKAKLPEHMVPAIVVLERMPLTVNGKIDRRALPAAEGTRGESYEAPQTPVQDVVASIWAKVLGVERVGIDENFFELGGHSLLATRAMSRIREAFQVEMPLRALFEAPTVRGLAEQVEVARRADQGLEIPKITRAERGEQVPLSFAQQRLWFLDQLDPGSPLYNVYAGYRMKGELKQEALEWSIGELVRRHETLRTHFSPSGMSAVQVVSMNEPLAFSIQDLSALPMPDREHETQRILAREFRQPFDLSTGPLFRVLLLRLHEHEHVLALMMHHIVTDEWSMGVLLKELAQLYEARKLGEESPLKELEIQYADYAIWQRGWLSGTVRERELEYWKSRLTGAPKVMELPADHARPAVMKHHGAGYAYPLPEELSEALRHLSRREGSTLFMTLLAGFVALLGRLAGQDDISIGTPIANRTRTEVEGLIGFFVNTLVIRTEMGDGPSFRDLVGRVREAALGAYGHQDVPFEMVVESSQPERSLSHAPLFQVMFTLQSSNVGNVELSGLELEGMAIGSGTGTSKFDLMLSVQDFHAGLMCGFEYSTELFDAGTIERMARQLELLLEGAVADPDRSVREIEILSPAEREELVVGWNWREVKYAEHSSVQAMFEEQAARQPDAVALIYKTERLNYGELNARANQLAHYLREHGVGAEVKVGICVERSVEMVVGILGILKAGGAYVPLDPNYPVERRRYMVKDAGLKLLLTQEELGAECAEPGIEVISIDRVGKDWERVGQQSKANPVEVAGGGNLAYVIYTSGSTGQPKGVGITHSNCVALLHWAQEVFAREALSGVLASTSMCFDLSVFEFFVPLSCGGSVIVAENALSLPLLAAAEEVTLVNTVPSVFAELLEVGGVPGSVRVVNLAGEALRRRLVEETHGLKSVEQVWNLYGPTEGTTYSTYVCMGREREKEKEPTIGVPIANTQVYVLDERMEPVAVGVVGELYIGGAGLARGYLNRPGLTGEKFVPNPFSGKRGARLYRTGDRTRWLAEGELEFLGRRDEQVKVRGYRIELGEIEAALLGMEEIAEAVVVVREDEPGDRRLVGYVVGRGGEGKEADVNAIRRALKAKLPEYMVPGQWVVMKRLPLTPNGKIDRAALPAAEGTRGESYEAPRTAEEEVLAGIWAQVLEVERVGIDENFFELGGHSLLAMRVMSRIREAFQVEMPLRVLFEAPTVRGLAEQVEAARHAGQGLEVPGIKRADRRERIPLSYAQQRLWFLDLLDPGSALYNVYVGYRMKGELDREALQWSIGELVRRHEILRTRFASDQGIAHQIAGSKERFAVQNLDLSGVEAALRNATLQAVLIEEAARPFNLAEGPVFRATLVKMEASEHVLVLVMHHIVTDERSLGVLLNELAQLYEARRLGEESPLKELAIQYADYAVWQRGWLSGAVLERELEYWRGRLSGAPEVLELPVDHARPAVMKHSGAIHTFVLPERLSGCLRELSQREGATLFMTLLAGYAALLGRLGGQEDISIGIPISNRTRAEVEGLIGFFVNALVVRIGVEDDLGFRELVGRVREAALETYAHQDVPLEMVVDALQPERSLSHAPLFQVMFMLQGANAGGVELSGLQLEGIEVGSGTGMSKFDLTLSVQDSQGDLLCGFEYSTELFETGTIERMARQLEKLLEGAVADPEQSIREIEILSPAEREELVVEWNRTEVEYGEKQSVVEMFEEQAARQPDAVAVVDKEEELSYGELNSRANQLAHYLRELGVGPEEKVGVCLDRSVALVVGILGIVKAGGAYVAMDAGYPAERLRYMVKDTGMKVLLGGEKVWEGMKEEGAEVSYLDINKDGEWEGVSGQSEGNLEREIEAGNLAYVIYTSGTTGEPKGVEISHGGLRNLVKWHGESYGIGRGDRGSWVAGTGFDASIWEMWGNLGSGASLHVMDEEVRGGAEQLQRWLREEGITVTFLPTPLAEGVLELETPMGGKLRELLTGGDALRRRPREGESFRLVNHYGPTENTVVATSGEVERRGEGLPGIGVPMANTQVYVLDEGMGTVGVGVVGELYVGGAGLARGYVNRRKLTAEKFVPNPWGGKKGERLYRTGDRVRWVAEGKLEFVGRRDGQVKVRGHRIEMGEIEAVLLGMEEIAEAVVVMREDVPGDRRLVGYVVGKGREELSVEEVRSGLKAKLPGYMVPAYIVVLERMPLTGNGKIDRRALPAAEPTRAGSYEAPRTAAEIKLGEIWQGVLGIERVGVYDNFFSLGGDSILSIQVVARARQAGLEVTAKQLFQNQTLGELARVAGQREEVEAKQEVVEGAVELTPIQEWFLEQEVEKREHWNQAMMLEVKQAVEEGVLEAVVGKVMERHDALWLRFVEGEGGWKSWSEGEPGRERAGIPYARVDLGGMEEEEQKVEMERHAEGVQRSLDLERGPVVRVVEYELGEGRGKRLLLVVHHLAMDGVSWRIVLEDLERGCRQGSEGKAIDLGAKTTSYQYWAKRLKEYGGGGEAEKEVEYWVKVGQGKTGKLAVDKAGGENTVASARHVVTVMSEEETQALLREVSEAYHTQINDVLLTGLGQAMEKWTGRREVLVNLEGHGREELFAEVDLTGTVGWFTSLFPVHLKLGRKRGVGEELKAIKEQLRAIPQRGIGYGVLRYGGAEGVREQLKKLPQAEISFNYLGQFDQVLGQDSWFGTAREDSGASMTAGYHRPHILDITGSISGGQLRLVITYSENLHRRSTIEALASSYVHQLRVLGEHCRTAGVGEYTPSDFALAELDDNELSRVMRQVGRESGK